MYNTELYHHGILGQKWGVRRYQNEDGSLTKAGKRREMNQFKSDMLRKYDKTSELEKKYAQADKEYEKGNYDKYDKLLAEADALSEERRKKAREATVAKYGEKAVKRNEQRDQVIGLTVITGGLLATIGTIKLAEFGAEKAIEGLVDIGVKAVTKFTKN